LHHITVRSLEESFEALRHWASPGVDGVSWFDYKDNLKENILKLHERIHRGSYQVHPSLRGYIPKSDGSKRPLGIAVIEDKIVQHAVNSILTAIYEEDFCDFSYGFRPKRGPHDALDDMFMKITTKKVNFILDADIQKFFDSISHDWMIRFLEHRIADKRILRLVRNWLKAGVIEEGKRLDTEKGCPQGGVISPLLANIYLHYVLDLWVENWQSNKAIGEVYIVRYADDFVMGFQYKDEATRFLRDLKERLAKFELALHPDKTRLIEFGRFAAENRRKCGKGKPETFDFLGFTHICSVARVTKKFKLLRQTISKRLKDKLVDLKIKLGRRMHDKIGVVGKWLKSVVKGYYNYFAVPDNTRVLSSFRHSLCKIWIKILRRRGQYRRITWDKFNEKASHWIPNPTPLHPYPSVRFRR
jgi:RNA-directed DNA polymerase